MGAEKEINPRARIMEVADHLFYTEGVRASGTEKIMAASNVAKATFYRHFESKDALVLAYLDNRDRTFWDYLDGPPTPKDVHEALAKIDRLVNAPGVSGCPFLLVASEYPDTVHPLHRRVTEHKEKLLAYLANLLRPFDIDKKEAAAKILTVIDGALSARMVFGTGRQAPLLSTAEAILKTFPKSSGQHRRS